MRVLRITPCYFDEQGSRDDDWSNATYQDLCKWTYLRTTCFDKDKYKEALESASNPTTISVDNYPLRPQSEEDMDRFCYVAVSLKQDAAETGGSSLNQVSLIAESFGPKYNLTERKWYPENINYIYKFFKKQVVNDETEIIEITEAEYEQIKDSDRTATKEIVSTDLARQIKQEIFTSGTTVNTDTYSKTLLPNEIVDKYVSNNTAAVFALALTGPHLKADAKTYENINKTALTDAYVYYEDFTDGTPDTTSDDGLKHFKFACNGVLFQERKLEDFLKNILLTARSALKRDEENKYEILISKPIDYPILLLNQQNVLSKSNNRTFEDVPSGLQVNFVDESDNYESNDIYIMDDGENYKNPTKDVESYSFEYVTNREQIWTLGRFNLGCRIYQREIYSRTVGKVGYLLSYGDMVLLQDESLEIGTDNGARIKELLQDDNYLYGFICDEVFEYTGEVDQQTGLIKQGCTIMQASKVGNARCVTMRFASPAIERTISGKTYKMQVGLTNIVLFANPINFAEDDSNKVEQDDDDSIWVSVRPKYDDIVAFGEVHEITIKAIITNIKPKDKERFDITLAPYNKDLYNMGKKMVEFKSHILQPVRDSIEPDFTDKASKIDLSKTKAETKGEKGDKGDTGVTGASGGYWATEFAIGTSETEHPPASGVWYDSPPEVPDGYYLWMRTKWMEPTEVTSVLKYLGTWNANTNSPYLVDGEGDNGDVYEVSVAGTQNLGHGAIEFNVGDQIVCDGEKWELLSNVLSMTDDDFDEVFEE
mgnify:CR=1 FL=1